MRSFANLPFSLHISALALAAALAAPAPAASKDLVIRQRTTTLDGPQEETQYWTPTRRVNDSTSMRLIVDFTAKSLTIADKNSKTYTVRSLDELRQQNEQLKKQRQQLPPEAQAALEKITGGGTALTLKPTGKTEQIAGYAAKEYAIEGGGPVIGAVWVTDRIEPPMDAGKWEAFNLAMGTPEGPVPRVTAAVAKLNGLALRSSMTITIVPHPTTVTTEVLEVTEQTPPPDALKVPAGFKQVNQ